MCPALQMRVPAGLAGTNWFHRNRRNLWFSEHSCSDSCALQSLGVETSSAREAAWLGQLVRGA
jgi:hypothetical protein